VTAQEGLAEPKLTPIVEFGLIDSDDFRCCCCNIMNWKKMHQNAPECAI